jgi:hypothetical protein
MQLRRSSGAGFAHRIWVGWARVPAHAHGKDCPARDGGSDHVLLFAWVGDIEHIGSVHDDAGLEALKAVVPAGPHDLSHKGDRLTSVAAADPYWRSGRSWEVSGLRSLGGRCGIPG